MVGVPCVTLPLTVVGYCMVIVTKCCLTVGLLLPYNMVKHSWYTVYETILEVYCILTVFIYHDCYIILAYLNLN